MRSCTSTWPTEKGLLSSAVLIKPWLRYAPSFTLLEFTELLFSLSFIRFKVGSSRIFDDIYSSIPIQQIPFNKQINLIVT